MTSWEPLLFTDPERFVRNVFGQDDEAARAREYHCVQDILFGEICRYGHFNDPKMVPRLAQLYDGLVERGMPADVRLAVYEQIVRALPHEQFIDVGALLPFICHDPDRNVVARATVDYVSLGPLVDNDPMSRPEELIQLIKRAQPRSPGAIFGGLLALGDPRVCALLWPLKDRLSEPALKAAMSCTSGTVAAATIEFVLTWLEGRHGTREDALFGLLASHLVLQRRHAWVDQVMTGLRPFPVTSVSDREYRAMGKWIPFEDYRRRIAPRLIALARSEPEPRIVWQVLEAWDIALPEGI